MTGTVPCPRCEKEVLWNGDACPFCGFDGDLIKKWQHPQGPNV